MRIQPDPDPKHCMAYSMDMDMQHGHGHAVRIWSCGMDLERDMHGRMDAGIPIKAQSNIVSFPLGYNA